MQEGRPAGGVSPAHIHHELERVLLAQVPCNLLLVQLRLRKLLSANHHRDCKGGGVRPRRTSQTEIQK
eukprot:1178732-Prorocentrum_minimum.AAC.1